jgi:hypothetical protein
MLKKFGSLPCVIIRSDLLETEAFEIEIALIAAIGREPNGPLVNLTAGGEGLSGNKRSPEVIERDRKNMLKLYAEDSTLRLRVSAGTKAAMAHPEVRKRVSDAQKRRFEDPGQRAAYSAARKGIPKKTPVSAETRKKLSLWQKGILRGPLSPESLAKRRAAIALSNGPASIKLNDKKPKGTYSRSKTWRERISLSLKGKEKSQEQREAYSRAQKAAWDKKREIAAQRAMKDKNVSDS